MGKIDVAINSAWDNVINKVALEFKLPKSINGNNSNQIEIRKNMYRYPKIELFNKK